jgi:hypothetical protein
MDRAKTIGEILLEIEILATGAVEPAIVPSIDVILPEPIPEPVNPVSVFGFGGADEPVGVDIQGIHKFVKGFRVSGDKFTG